MTKIWLITGANSGFGRAIAEAALAAGGTVVAAARRPETLDDLVARHPGRVNAVALDVTDRAQAADVVADAVLWHGRVDVLVNNAGRGVIGAVEETTDRELRDLMDLHFFGPAALTRAVLPHMRRQGSGAIVQMSSMGGRFSLPGVGAYSATKFALEGLSEVKMGCRGGNRPGTMDVEGNEIGRRGKDAKPSNAQQPFRSREPPKDVTRPDA
ncbi:SDR family NAD(P)-dependent oxidoreductase [Actinomadura sp. B10D3]|uniref:SDR family NAD(P)-dependent oxidoreductase n=1 Tax=Actinomadura sp. B10D3 TaxID=3153557 RepID=UPI00325DC778